MSEEAQEHARQVQLEMRIKRAVSKALKRNASIELAFTAQAIALAKKRKLELSREELVALGQRTRSRMKAQAPDRYLALIQAIETRIDYDERAN